MNSVECYCWGVAYATGYIAKDEGKMFLCVRNLDSWYPKCIENISSNKAYKLRYNIERDNAPQWVIKARNISELPKLFEIIQALQTFCGRISKYTERWTFQQEEAAQARNTKLLACEYTGRRIFSTTYKRMFRQSLKAFKILCSVLMENI